MVLTCRGPATIRDLVLYLSTCNLKLLSFAEFEVLLDRNYWNAVHLVEVNQRVLLI